MRTWIGAMKQSLSSPVAATMVFLFSLILVVMQAGDGYAKSPQLLARDAAKLYSQLENQTDAVRRGEIYYKIALIIEDIRRDHGSTMTARRLKRGKLGTHKFDLKFVLAKAAEWATSNPERALNLKKRSEVAVVPKVEPAVKNRKRKKIEPSEDSDKTTRSDDEWPDIPSLFSKDDGSNGISDKKDDDVVDDYPPQKMTRAQVFARMKKAVVDLLFVAIRDNQRIVVDVGTGFFISPTHILTNAHVAEQADAIWKEHKLEGYWVAVNRTMGLREVRILKNARIHTSQKIDAAVMEVMRYKSPVFLPFATGVKEGEWIAIGGYPGRAIKGDAANKNLAEFIEKGRKPPLPEDAIPGIRFDSGILSNKYTDNSSKARNLQYSLETTGGNSGSPIVNACGEIVGLHYSGTRASLDVTKTKSGGLVARGDTSKYNSAVAAEEVTIFLNRIGIKIKVAAGPCQVG